MLMVITNGSGERIQETILTTEVFKQKGLILYQFIVR